MITMSPAMIRVALWGAAVLLVVGSYFAWKHHVQTVEREKVMRQMAESSAKLMQHKIAEVKKENDELQERKNNAIQAYAEHSTNRQRDVDNLTRRLRDATSSCRNTLPGKTDDTPIREGQDQPDNTRLAGKIVDLMNSCELWVNQIPVEEK